MVDYEAIVSSLSFLIYLASPSMHLASCSIALSLSLPSGYTQAPPLNPDGFSLIYLCASSASFTPINSK